MERTVIIGGKEYRMRASALIPKLYRFRFNRDCISDLRAIQKKLKDAEEPLDVMDLTIFENIAWLMCRQADKTIPDDPDEWLDSIDGAFSVYEALPQIMELWEAGNATTSVPAKK